MKVLLLFCMTHFTITKFPSFLCTTILDPLPTQRLRSCWRPSFVQKQQRRWDFGPGNCKKLSCGPLETVGDQSPDQSWNSDTVGRHVSHHVSHLNVRHPITSCHMRDLRVPPWRCHSVTTLTCDDVTRCDSM